MTNDTTTADDSQLTAEATGDCPDLFDNWIDPLESMIRERVRGLIEEMIHAELDGFLARPRYGRRKEDEPGPAVAGYRHGSRTRTLIGTFGKTEITVPRARLERDAGPTTEWHSSALRAYQRRTLATDVVITGAYLAGTNPRRVQRALKAVFGGAVGKDTVSRTWRKVKGDWDAWNARSLAEEPIVRLILDGTFVRVRLDRKATAISLLVVVGIRADGQKVLLAVKSEGASYCP
jgi:putative transposase